MTDQPKVLGHAAPTAMLHATKSTSSTMPLSQTPAASYNTSDDNIAAAKKELLDIFGKDGVNDRIGDLVAHSSTPWSEAPSRSDHASIIVFPSTTEEVSQIVQIAIGDEFP
jgi:hypothetical protein